MYCASCKAPCSADAKFCSQCGHAIAAKADASRPQSAPGVYTPKHLADKILASRSAMEGEKKQVTVLFCDAANSMGIADALGPERWHARVNEFFAVLTAAIHRFEGTVNQYTGDGIMALFGAPIAAEDHARRACMAALEIQQQLDALRVGVEQECGLAFAARIGINSGEVVVGRIGDDLRMDYTAQGQVVGIAARLEALAPLNGVLISAHTEKQIGALARLKPLGPTQIKGVNRALELFELISIEAVGNRFALSRKRGLTRFVGRDADMATLDAALQQARSDGGNGQVVGVVAEAGTGKSRLCFEFLQRCKADGMTVLEGNAVSHGRHIPYLPMLQIFRAYYGITPQDDARTAREKIAGRLLLLSHSFKDVLPILFDFFGISDPAAPPLNIAPEARQRQLFNVLRQIVRGVESERRMYVSYIEDLHWLDAGSEAFLEQWVEAVAGSDAFLLVNFRPEYHAEWMQKSHYRQLPLAPLNPQAVQAMLADLLGDDPSVAGLSDAIFERTCGNPFYCEEVVASLVETGVLQGTAGRYALTAKLSALQIPASVQAVLAARIDRLPDDDKAVLQTAAVIGRVFSESLLALVAPLGAAAVTRALQQLKSSEFIFQRSRDIPVEYSFRHALTQEVALNSQLTGKRQHTHAAVARAIETLNAENPLSVAPLIAHHWESAGERLIAAQWFLRAAEHIVGRDIVQAMQHMQAVLRLTDALPESEARDACRLHALTALLMRGGWRVGLARSELDAYFHEAQRLVVPLNAPDTAAMVQFGYAASLGVGLGDVKTWGQLINEVSERRDTMSVAVRIAALGCNRGEYLFACGRLDDALDEMRAAHALLGEDYEAGYAVVGFSALAELTTAIAFVLSHCGQLCRALRDIQAIRQVLLEKDLFEEWIWSVTAEMEARYLMGQRPDADAAALLLKSVETACEQARDRTSDFTNAYSLRALVLARLLCGEWDAAVVECEALLAMCRTRRTYLYREAQIMACLSDALLSAGRLAEAEQIARETISRAQEQGAQVFEASGHIALARALIHQRGVGAADEIRLTLEAAMRLVDDTGARTLLPQVVEQRGRLAAMLGDAGAAREHQRTARALYLEIGADGHALRLAWSKSN